MDTREFGIGTQVAFKGAVDLCQGTDVTTPEGQAEFISVFSFLSDALLEAIRSGESPAQQAAQIIQGNFPGSQMAGSVQPMQDPYANGNSGYTPPQHVTPSVPPGGVSVKGNQHGPLPDWLFEQAASKGVTEVYDNRDRAQGTKRPWFRATTGGDNAPAFWPPR